MADIEKKIIEIKNASDTGVKENLYENKSVSHLNRDNIQDFEAAFGKLTDAGVQDVFDNTKSELIRKGNTLVIAQKSADGKLMPKLVIDGGSRDKTYELTVNFMKHLINVHLRNIYQETTIEIAKNKDVTSVIASVKESLASASKEIPTKERIKELIHAINDQYQEEISLLNSFRKDHIIGGFKLKFDEQQRNNVALLRKMTEGHAKDLHFINERFYNITGVDAISGKTNPTLEKDLRNPVYSEAFIKYNADLMYMSKQFNNIIALTNDPGFIRGKYPLSATNIVDYGLYGKDEIASFVKRFEKNKTLDKERVEEMMKVAMIGLADQDYKALFNHLKGVAEGDIDPVQNPFQPKNVDKVKELVKNYPFLKEYGILEAAKEQKKNDKSSGGLIENKTDTGKDQGINKTPANAEQAKAAGAYKDWLDAFGRGGVAGLGEFGLDKTSMTPSQKRTWETVGNLALTGGMIFVGWKMISSAWKLLRGTDKADPKKQTKNRQWLLGPAGVILASNVATGESPLALIKGGKATKWMSDLIGGWFGQKAPETGSQTVLKLADGFTGVTSLFSGYKYEQVAEFVEEKNGIMKIREDSYDTMKEFYKEKNNDVAVKFLESIGKGDKKNLVHLGLTAMGIKSIKDLEDTPEASFSATASGSIMKLISISTRMEKYDSINPDAMDDLEAYIANKDAKIDVLDALEARGDVFERNEDLKDITGMAEKIKEIAQGDEKKETVLLRALNRFYSQMPAGSKKVEISGARPTIEFKTYDSITPINLETKEIAELAKFPGQLELFKAANLTNYIKKTFKDKQAHSIEPFTVSSLGKDVEFDNTKTWSFAIDTEVISAGPGGTLEKISPTLENKKEAYAKYLNAHVEFKKPVTA